VENFVSLLEDIEEKKKEIRKLLCAKKYWHYNIFVYFGTLFLLYYFFSFQQG